MFIFTFIRRLLLISVGCERESELKGYGFSIDYLFCGSLELDTLYDLVNGRVTCEYRVRYKLRRRLNQRLRFILNNAVLESVY